MQALEIKQAIKEKILAKTGVAGIGIHSSPQEIIIYAEALTSDIMKLPASIAGVSVRIVESGRFFALQAGQTLAGLEVSKTARIRPAPGGVSIGHFKITAGTLASRVYDKITGKRLMLSNNHVLANNNQGIKGDPIYQPGSYDGGTDADTIATLERFVEILPPPDTNLVDTALGIPIIDADLSDEILDIGIVEDIEEALIGMHVAKSGRTTCYKEADIQDVNATVKVYGYPWDYSIFEDQIITSILGEPGDSGSCVVNTATKKAVGLLFAGSATLTVLNKMTNVANLLNIDFRVAPPPPPPPPPYVKASMPLIFTVFMVGNYILGWALEKVKKI